MSNFTLNIIVMLCLAGSAQAQTKKINTNLYEQETEKPKTTSFTSKVRVVRDISDDLEVFFESKDAQGAYTLPRSLKNYGAMLADLEKSKKPAGPSVTVTADSDKRIQSVEIGKGSSSSSNPYDPGKIPD